MSEKPDIYDIATYVEKARHALRTMQERSTPGQRNGLGRRMDILREVKDDIAEVMKLGYSSQQIADAFANGDVFKIRPKSVTQLMNSSTKLNEPKSEDNASRGKQRSSRSLKRNMNKIGGHQGRQGKASREDGSPQADASSHKRIGPRPDRQ